MKASKDQQISSIALADAFRSYLARHLSGKRCWDNEAQSLTAALGATPDGLRRPTR